MRKATRQQTRNHNTRLVLKTIYDQEGISRADGIGIGTPGLVDPKTGTVRQAMNFD